MSRTLADHFLSELEEEAATTRRLLKRVSEGRNDFQPHPKSMPFGYLAMLVATMPGWIPMILDQDFLDLAPVDGSGPPRVELTTVADLLERFDQAVGQAQDALRRTTDTHLLDTTWQLRVAGKVVAESSRYHNVRVTTMNHWAHHRGQLTVYLRMLDQPLPPIYGPTADERSFG
jgi:uncharacterized damage-inducible protein DinB